MGFFKSSKNIAKNKTKGNANVNIQNSNVNINKGMDGVLELAKQGKNIEALRKMGVFQRSYSAMHPLYPDFRYSLNMNENGVFIKEVPNNEEALKKHPPNGKIKFIIPNEYKWANNIKELIQYGYEKQIPIKLKAKDIKLFLGNHLMEDIEGESDVELISEKFPDPVPMKFEFENNLFSLDYLEIGLVRIENGYLILSNEKQEKTKIILTLSINTFDMHDNKFNIRIAENYINNVDANLKINKFLFNVSKEGMKKLILLKDESEFISFSELNLHNQNLEEIKKEIEFLQRLLKLEKHYNVNFKLPERITEEDYEKLLILEKSMKDEPITGTYSEIKISLNVDCNLNQMAVLNKTTANELSFMFNNEEIEIFGVNIKFKEKLVSYHNALVENKDKVLKKFEVADEGDVLNVKFIPLDKNNNKFKVYYKFK